MSNRALPSQVSKEVSLSLRLDELKAGKDLEEVSSRQREQQAPGCYDRKEHGVLQDNMKDRGPKRKGSFGLFKACGPGQEFLS